MATMPEFEMPREVAPPPRAPATGPDSADVASDGARARLRVASTPTVVGATELTAEPEPLEAPTLAPRPRVVWRHVLVAALVGAIVGAAVPATLQAVDRAAAAAEVDGLRALATDYLTAIVEQRADDATALVPVPTGPRSPGLAPAALLAAAGPIERPEVRLVHVDGIAGTVEVRYRAGGSDVFRTLDAERVGGSWRITTSLTEVINVYSMDDRAAVTIAGTTIESGRVLLYPGSYVPDRTPGPVLVSRGERFVVDGDPGTPTETYSISELAPELIELAGAHALAAVEECRRVGTCVEAGAAALSATDQVHVVVSDLERGRLELSVPLSGDSPMAPWVEVRMQLSVDPDGTPVSWQCGRPGTYDGEWSPCPTIG